MREILFRGKRKDNGEWVEGCLIKIGEYCCILEMDCEDYGITYLDSELGYIDGPAIPVIPETVGQFTGLTDSCDNKIFEGDIVAGQVLYDVGCYPHCEMATKIVAYDADLCAFTSLYKLNINGPVTVIGNIYDSPELTGVRL